MQNFVWYTHISFYGVHPRCGFHFHEGSKYLIYLGMLPHAYIQNAVFMMNDDNLILHKLHFITADFSFITAHFIFITAHLFSDSPLF